MKNNIRSFFWVTMIFALWQIVYLTKTFPEVLFPSPTSVITSLLDAILDGSMIQAIGYSLWVIFMGLFIGVFLAVSFSFLSIRWEVFESFIRTCISIAHPLPGIALLPLIILWIGTDSKAIIFIIVHSVLWPLALNLLTGFQAVPEIYIQVGRNIGLSRLKMMLHIYLPASLPFFISGLKISWARAWRALVSAEMIFGAAGGIGGIGWLIYKNRVFMDTAGLFASIIVIISIGIMVENLLFAFIEKKTLKKWGMHS